MMNYLRKCVNELMQHRAAGPFKEPVDPVALSIPDYFAVVKHPMDLSTIRDKIPTFQPVTSSDSKTQTYTARPTKKAPFKTVKEILGAIHLVWDNCYLYNKAGSEVVEMAIDLQKAFAKKLERMVEKGWWTAKDVDIAGTSTAQDLIAAKCSSDTPSRRGSSPSVDSYNNDPFEDSDQGRSSNASKRRGTDGKGEKKEEDKIQTRQRTGKLPSNSTPLLSSPLTSSASSPYVSSLLSQKQYAQEYRRSENDGHWTAHHSASSTAKKRRSTTPSSQGISSSPSFSSHRGTKGKGKGQKGAGEIGMIPGSMQNAMMMTPQGMVLVMTPEMVSQMGLSQMVSGGAASGSSKGGKKKKRQTQSNLAVGFGSMAGGDKQGKKDKKQRMKKLDPFAEDDESNDSYDDDDDDDDDEDDEDDEDDDLNDDSFGANDEDAAQAFPQHTASPQVKSASSSSGAPLASSPASATLTHPQSSSVYSEESKFSSSSAFQPPSFATQGSSSSSDDQSSASGNDIPVIEGQLTLSDDSPLDPILTTTEAGDDVPLSLDEKEVITNGIGNLAMENLDQLIRYLHSITKDSDKWGEKEEVEFDIEEFNTQTQHKLLRYITKYEQQ
ncbi:putative Bromodomain [Monocercomonoides exilis]|uniref:putative Bromodomain n=1 Tax=Monocercomonoides exilis TaxID=2049356 RepID=UPI00355A386C|nr:putative Bromodomain [Monocercomonoides exilis]|eukprot:MONOS_11577.1-p1 / transcript=MONOS_11577.1 / gene=MONOS_11577 / organism=Monocercomonoides_exilis_PA203 / gene_product=unspecified product / transcript_product=unspecified product / location=Mono_scaffold00588:17620-20365(-) / protein_length=607 / sequence_SO=supercontig / SO=protein_coding / is_pseudo=false